MKKYINSIQILMLSILTASYVFCNENTFVLKSYSEVSDNKIYFKDIAELKNTHHKIANVEIGKSALPKNFRIISKQHIYTKLRQAGYGDVLLVGEDKIKVVTKHSLVSHEDIFNFVKEHIKSIYQDDININSVGKMQDIVLPYGNVSFKMNDVKENSAVVDILVDDKICKTVKVNLKIDRFAYGYFAKKNILKNELLKVDDFEKKKINVSHFPRDIVLDETFFKDAVARQAILFGQVLRKVHIGEKFSCRKGDIVQIIGKDGLLEITLEGKALQNGNIGDDIKVITSTKKEILAKVKGEKIVEVKLSGGE